MSRTEDGIADRPGPRTQAMRREETIRNLYDATIKVMLDDGYARLTTPLVARTANISRGALTHHFASREELITQSIADHLRGVNRELFAFAEGVGQRQGELDEIIDYLWRMMADGLFYVTMEYLPEARHNDEFRESLIPVVQEFHRGLDAIWNAFADRQGLESARTAMLFNMTMCLIRGMIAQTILRDDPAYYADMLAEWKAWMPRLLRPEDGCGE